MLYAAIMHSPVFKGKLKSVDDSKIGGLKGIRKVVELDDAVAVVADSWWRAKKGLEALSVTWDEGENGKVSSATIRDFVLTGLTAPEAGVGEIRGNVAEGFAKAAKRIEAEYATPFLSHATMEPMNCTAHVTDDKLEIWVPTQSSERLVSVRCGGTGYVSAQGGCAFDAGGRRLRAAWRNTGLRAAGSIDRQGDRTASQDRMVARGRHPARLLPAGDRGQTDRRNSIPPELRSHGRYVWPAVRFWPAYGLTASRTVSTSTMQEGFLEDVGYDVPDYLVAYALRIPHVPVGFWRGVNSSQNAFYKESFIDEMAHAAGQDPYQFRRKLLEKKPKLLAVLDAVAKKANWGTPLPSGVFRGVAIQQAYDSYVAHVVEASVSDKGQIKVHRVVAAIDPGYAVNPLTIEAQAEGSVVWALTAALYGEITIKDGRVEQSNFDDYEMVRLAEMPKVETIVVPSGGFWGGVGEPFMAPLAPALCNAIFAATGKRIRTLPLKNHDLRKA